MKGDDNRFVSELANLRKRKPLIQPEICVLKKKYAYAHHPLFLSHQYTDQLIPNHQQYSPPTSPLPGDEMQYIYLCGCVSHISFMVSPVKLAF